MPGVSVLTLQIVYIFLLSQHLAVNGLHNRRECNTRIETTNRRPRQTSGHTRGTCGADMTISSCVQFLPWCIQCIQDEQKLGTSRSRRFGHRPSILDTCTRDRNLFPRLDRGNVSRPVIVLDLTPTLSRLRKVRQIVNRNRLTLTR